MKYVFVTGGVVSGLGKGITASSIGVILKACGLCVTFIKMDPYLNRDAGTMSPFEHGEVFVLDDGAEVDLDLGNYERFLDITMTRDNSITMGKIYQSVLDKERRGDFLGKTVQVVPHVTSEIQEWIERAAAIPVDGIQSPPDVCVIELGGTVGDIESSSFIEALSQFQFQKGQDNVCSVHVSLVPVIGVVGEQKTKPTQHGVRELRARGIIPNIIACRSAKPLESATREKLSRFCKVPNSHIITVHDVRNVWEVPLMLRDQNVHSHILEQLKLSCLPQPELRDWTVLAQLEEELKIPVRIGVVGKYTDLEDAYHSVIKALKHAALACRRKLEVKWIESSHLENDALEVAHNAAWATLKDVDGVLVPGGFGTRGTEGKISAAKYAREQNVPYLGICLGMQVAVRDISRSMLGVLEGSVGPMPQQTSMTQKGGTARLGTSRVYFQTSDCVTAKLYGGNSFVEERHRHRHSVNLDLLEKLEGTGVAFVARDETKSIIEIIELPKHKFFVGVQYHPEFKSRPGKPSPVFLGLVLAASGQLQEFLENEPSSD